MRHGPGPGGIAAGYSGRARLLAEPEGGDGALPDQSRAASTPPPQQAESRRPLMTLLSGLTADARHRIPVGEWFARLPKPCRDRYGTCPLIPSMAGDARHFAAPSRSARCMHIRRTCRCGT